MTIVGQVREGLQTVNCRRKRPIQFPIGALDAAAARCSGPRPVFRAGDVPERVVVVFVEFDIFRRVDELAATQSSTLISSRLRSPTSIEPDCISSGGHLVWKAQELSSKLLQCLVVSGITNDQFTPSQQWQIERPFFRRVQSFPLRAP